MLRGQQFIRCRKALFIVSPKPRPDKFARFIATKLLNRTARIRTDWFGYDFIPASLCRSKRFGEGHNAARRSFDRLSSSVVLWPCGPGPANHPGVAGE